MQTRQALHSRIRSVESTRKITKVMQLIASTELTKQRRKMEENQEYAQGLDELLSFAANASEDSMYLKASDKPSVTIVFTSDMGLCGAYNANVLRKLDGFDSILMVGSVGQAYARANNLDVENVQFDDAYHGLSDVVESLLEQFESNQIGKIQVLYTHFKNVLTYEPILETILPVQKRAKGNQLEQGIDFEPRQEEMLDKILPMALKSLVYARYLESKTSEQASRRMAMETATDNADELHDELMLAYNQARQAAITNEIIDIVGGANIVGGNG